jgi:hypothetical protein
MQRMYSAARSSGQQPQPRTACADGPALVRRAKEGALFPTWLLHGDVDRISSEHGQIRATRASTGKSL